MSGKKIKFIKNIVIRFVVYFLILSIIYGFFGYSFYKKEKEYQLNDIIQHETSLINSQNNNIVTTFSIIFSDLLYLVDAFEIDYIQHESYKEIEDILCSFSKRKKFYDQIRMIDINGNEEIRIDYDQNFKNGIVIPEERLQNKANRYYFWDTIDGEKSEIFVSQLDLNIENGEIETPIKPVIRVGTPLYDGFNKIGIVLLNYKAQEILDGFEYTRLSSIGKTELLNADGYYLSCIDSESNWGFLYPDKMNKTLAKTNSKLYKTIIETKNGTFLDDKNMYIYRTVDFANLNGVVDEKIAFKEKPWIILSTIEKNDEYASIIEINSINGFKNFFKDSYKTFLNIILVSILLAIILSVNASNKEKIKYYSEFDPLTSTYNRRAGFDYINKAYDKSKSENKKMSICFMDVNGLKLINDNLGHESGDEIIKSVVECIKTVIRTSDILVRLGGDEFLLGLPGANHAKAEEIWSRIKEEFDRINTEEQRDYAISVSHGVTELDYSNRHGLEEIIDKADKIMYAEKNIIKQNVVILRKGDKK